MIFDRLNNLSKYSVIPNLDSVLGFLKKNDVMALAEGDIEINGRDVYVKVLNYHPKTEQENSFETHRRYMDVQVVVHGREKMQVVDAQELSPTMNYDEKNDYQFFSANRNISDIVVGEKEFIVFFPGEAHKPGCLYCQSKDPVRKLVFKIKCKN